MWFLGKKSPNLKEWVRRNKRDFGAGHRWGGGGVPEKGDVTEKRTAFWLVKKGGDFSKRGKKKGNPGGPPYK